jgi:glutathione reductase (NADPH)
MPESQIMRKKFDLIVIGTGTAASTVAYECRSAGWDVAVIDSRPFGGTCALRGCDPKKVLVGAAEVVDWVRRMSGRGVRADDARIEWAELMRFKRSFTGPVPQSSERSFAKAGIAAFHGRARFVGSTALQVGDDVLEGRHVVIAAGAMPRKLGIPGEQYITTSDQFLELEQLPRRIVFIGGGYISFEFAHVSARAGAEVTILHSGQAPWRDLIQILSASWWKRQNASAAGLKSGWKLGRSRNLRTNLRSTSPRGACLLRT